MTLKLWLHCAWSVYRSTKTQSVHMGAFSRNQYSIPNKLNPLWFVIYADLNISSEPQLKV